MQLLRLLKNRSGVIRRAAEPTELQGARLRLVLPALVLLACLATFAAAQAADANISGVVHDQTGAAVANAKVIAVNEATGVETTGTTNGIGEFRLNDIPIGTYDLTASANHFAPSTLKGFVLALNQTLDATLTLQPASVSTSVNVTEAGVAINTTNAQVATDFDRARIDALPTSTLPFGALNLSLLAPGVASPGGVGIGTGPSVGGQRPEANGFNVEGVDNNRKDVSGPVVSVPTDATAEVGILENQFGPEFGHSSAAQFNTVVRAGTNQYHGSLYEYLENRKLDAYDQAYVRQFAGGPVGPKPRYDSNLFGGTIGGPIVHGKLFFFTDLEYNPVGEASVSSSPPYAPTAAGYTTLNSLQSGGAPAVINGYTRTISKTNLAQLEQYVAPASTAAPNCPSAGTPPAGCLSYPVVQGVAIPIGFVPVVGPNYTNTLNWVGSVDFDRSSSDTWRWRYIYNGINSIDAAAEYPAFYQTAPIRQHLMALSEFHTFSPTLLNELRLAFTRYADNFPAGNYAYPGLDQFPNLDLDELNTFVGPDPVAPQSTDINSYQLVDNVDWTKGDHSFKFGGDIRRLIAPQTFVQRARGEYEWSTLQGFLDDMSPDVFGERTLGISPYQGNQWLTYFYANDDWRLTRNLTLNLGLRWEYDGVPKSETEQTVNAVSNVPGVLTFDSPKAQTNDWGPRVGFNYAPGNGRLSINGGYGIAYDVLRDNLGTLTLPPQDNNTVDVDVTNPTPCAYGQTSGCTGFLAGGGIPASARPTALSPAVARALTSGWVAPAQTLPYAETWDLRVQRRFGNDYVFTVGYLGTHGVHFPLQQRLNGVAAVTSSRYLPTYAAQPSAATLNGLTNTFDSLAAIPENSLAADGFDSYITAYLPQGWSYYNGMDLELQKRQSHGLTLIVSYTWSHDIDNSTDDGFGTYLTPRRPQDFGNTAVEKADSALDRRQRLTISETWQTPFFRSSSNWLVKAAASGWLLAGDYTAESPEYATVQSGDDANLNGDSAGDRAIANPGGITGTGGGVNPIVRISATSDAGASECAGAVSAGYCVGNYSSGGVSGTVAYVADNPNTEYWTAGPGALATAGRNTLPLIGINNFDLSLGKSFAFGESRSFMFRADAFNALNHPQYTPGFVNNIQQTKFTATRTFLEPDQSSFNQVSQQFSSSPRVIQLTVKIIF